MYDGTLKFDTAVDVSGFQTAIAQLSELARGANPLAGVQQNVNVLKDSLTTALSGAVTQVSLDDAMQRAQALMDMWAEQVYVYMDAAIVAREFDTLGNKIALLLGTEFQNEIKNQGKSMALRASETAKSVVGAFESLPQKTADIAANAMSGMLSAMNAHAPTLYAKANEIATSIASTMARALAVKSPSRVMMDIFGHVMMGVYEGMENSEQMLYGKAEKISEEIAQKLSANPAMVVDFAGGFGRAVSANRSVVSSAFGGVPAVSGAAGASYNQTFVQNNYSPEPISPAQASREMQSMLQRSKWRLP